MIADRCCIDPANAFLMSSPLRRHRPDPRNLTGRLRVPILPPRSTPATEPGGPRPRGSALDKHLTAALQGSSTPGTRPLTWRRELDVCSAAWVVGRYRGG